MMGYQFIVFTGMNEQSSGVVQLEGVGGETVTSRFVAFSDQIHILMSSCEPRYFPVQVPGSIAEMLCVVGCLLFSSLILMPRTTISKPNANFLGSQGWRSGLPGRRYE